MLPPPNPPNEEVMICPQCGSSKVERTNENTYRIVPGNAEMNEYVCKDCNIKFFPAMDNMGVTSQQKLKESWSSRVDQSLWQDRMREKKYSPKVYFIRIEK
jgi:DNA-directed RNA polymerase subunit RPC12/RpoP